MEHEEEKGEERPSGSGKQTGGGPKTTSKTRAESRDSGGKEEWKPSWGSKEEWQRLPNGKWKWVGLPQKPTPPGLSQDQSSEGTPKRRVKPDKPPAPPREDFPDTSDFPEGWGAGDAYQPDGTWKVSRWTRLNKLTN